MDSMCDEFIYLQVICFLYIYFIYKKVYMYYHDN